MRHCGAPGVPLPTVWLVMALLFTDRGRSSSSSFSPCQQELARLCGAAASGHGAAPCGVCCGMNQHLLRTAGCTSEDCGVFCIEPDHNQPKAFDEVNATSIAECCDRCGAEPRCQFWAFKATDVAKGIACRRYPSRPMRNKTSGDFVSGARPPLAPAPPSPPGMPARLRINGSQLLLPDGVTPVRLVGFSWVLHHIHDNDGALMQTQLPGTNVARVVAVLWDNSNGPDGQLAKADCLMNVAPYFKDTCFHKMDSAIRQATDAGLWVVITCRAAFAAGQDFDSHPMANVFHNQTLQAMMFTMWRHVAAHYASWERIAAYEIMAEPRDKGVSAAAVRDFYGGGCRAVREVDPATPCMVGPAPYYKLWTFDSSIVLDIPNVIYTFDYFVRRCTRPRPLLPPYLMSHCIHHTVTRLQVPEDWSTQDLEKKGKPGGIPAYNADYRCDALYPGWTSQCCPGGAASTVTFDAQFNAHNFARAVAVRDQHNVPIFVNQWAVVHSVPAQRGRYKWMSDVAQELQRLGIGWAWWNFRGGGSGGWAAGSSEFVYGWSNGTDELDQQAFDAVRPYIKP
eukprot:COSAG01_NODE_666_length_14393_cov_8.519029_5_plen_566_part_00